MNDADPSGTPQARVKHIAARFAADTLASMDRLREADDGGFVSILPLANVVKIGA